jgi:hypothetical protein
MMHQLKKKKLHLNLIYATLTAERCKSCQCNVDLGKSLESRLIYAASHAFVCFFVPAHVCDFMSF